MFKHANEMFLLANVDFKASTHDDDDTDIFFTKEKKEMNVKTIIKRPQIPSYIKNKEQEHIFLLGYLHGVCFASQSTQINCLIASFSKTSVLAKH